MSSLRYSPRSKVLAITRDGITFSTRYDALGDPLESGYRDGLEKDRWH